MKRAILILILACGAVRLQAAIPSVDNFDTTYFRWTNTTGSGPSNKMTLRLENMPSVAGAGVSVKAGSNVSASTNLTEVTVNADVSHTEVSNATNGLSGVLVTRITAATNDLNSTLVTRVTAATNDLNSTLTTRITNATNDLNTTLTTKITNATNDLNTVLVASIATKAPSTRSISTTSPLSGGGDLGADRTLSIANAAADGSTKGAAAFTASDFNAASGVISLDYANGQAASGSVPGFLSTADWTTFNGKLSSLTPWTTDVSAAFHNLTTGATLVSSNSIMTNSFSAGTNGVAPAGIVGDIEGAARVTGTLSVSNAFIGQGNVTLFQTLAMNALTANRMLLTDGSKQLSSAAASGPVPMDADGSAATFAQLNTVHPALTNGETRNFGVSGVPSYTNSFMILSNAQSQLTAIVAAMPSGSVYPWVSNDVAYLIIKDRSAVLTTNRLAIGSGGGDAVTSGTLAQFAPTTSSQFFGVISDETGSGLVVGSINPTINSINGGQTPTTNWNLITVSNGTLTAASLQGGSNLWSAFGYGGTNLAHITTNHVYVRDLNIEGAGSGALTLWDSDASQSGVITAPSDFTANRTFTLPDATGTFALTANNLSVFGATTSAQLAGVLSDETGSGLAVFATSPTLTTPTIGVATATSVNKWTLTAPTTAATLTAGADNLTYTGPSTSQTLVGRTSTDTLQNKTFDAADTGNVFKMKGYIQLKNFDNITGAKPNNTNDYTVSTFMKPVFLNATAATANFIQFQIQVPTDFDTAVDPKIKITDKLTAGDTGVRRYIVSTISPAASAAYDGTVGTAINVDIAADASGASGDVEQSSQVTLTGWGAALTAGRHWVIQIGRDGNSGTDTSTVDSMFSVAEIEYGITQ